jgi:hypothetical protein
MPVFGTMAASTTTAVTAFTRRLPRLVSLPEPERRQLPVAGAP